MSQQPGYTIVGTTDALSPILIPSNSITIVRSLTISQGTWLLNAVANVSNTSAVFLSKLIVGFSNNLAKLEESGFIANMIPGCHFGRCLSRVVQVSEPTSINLEITAVFTTSDGQLYVNNVDDEYIRFTATLLSS